MGSLDKKTIHLLPKDKSLLTEKDKAELKDWIETKTLNEIMDVTGLVNYKLIGSELSRYLVDLYIVFGNVLNGVIAEKKNKGRINTTKNKELRSIIEIHLIDIRNPLNMNQMKVSLERLQMKYESNEQDNITEMASAFAAKFGKFATKMGTAAKVISTVAALATFLYTGYLQLKKYKIQKQRLADMAASDKTFRDTYNNIIHPKLIQILDEVLYNRIKDAKQLKKSFYKLIDDIIKHNPNIAPYLRAWGARI